MLKKKKKLNTWTIFGTIGKPNPDRSESHRAQDRLLIVDARTFEQQTRKTQRLMCSFSGATNAGSIPVSDNVDLNKLQ